MSDVVSHSLFHSSKLSMAPLICSSKSLAISFCCKDIDSISLNLFSKKLTRITMISKILLMLLCINVTSLFHMSFLVQSCSSMNSLLNAPILLGDTNPSRLSPPTVSLGISVQAISQRRSSCVDVLQVKQLSVCILDAPRQMP